MIYVKLKITILKRKMLTNAPGALVKDMKKEII